MQSASDDEPDDDNIAINDAAAPPPALHAWSPDPADDPDEVPGVQTGEDVIAFYGKYGQDSSVKFFYCVRCVTLLLAWAADPKCWQVL
jgi:hypothetical protein